MFDTLIQKVLTFLKLAGKSRLPDLTQNNSQKRKPPDTTPITIYHYDYIIMEHSKWKDWNKNNPKDRKSAQWLVDKLNADMEMNKSMRALSRVWCREIKREDLPIGSSKLIYKLS